MKSAAQWAPKDEKMRGPPKGARWVWQTSELRESDAWRSQGINARRFIDFLLIEDMRRSGKKNGDLKAPYEQLEAFGISARRLADAIREAEELGLVDCFRGGMRVATTYALTWLPLHDGTPATNRWRGYRNTKLKPLAVPKFRNLPDKVKAGLPDKVKADDPNLPDKVKADGRENLPDKVKVLLRSSYQGLDDGPYVHASAMPVVTAGRVPKQPEVSPSRSGVFCWRRQVGLVGAIGSRSSW